MIIKLIDYTNDAHPNGNVKGKEVFQKLSEVIEKNCTVDVFGISLKGIEATDASFPRESVIALAKKYRCEKSFYLTDMIDIDLFDNWSYGANAKEQPLVVWNSQQYKIIGPDMSKATKQMVEYVLDKVAVTTSQVAGYFNLSTPNASTRLKKLYNSGYIMRSEEIAESGGKEFVYKAIK